MAPINAQSRFSFSARLSIAFHLPYNILNCVKTSIKSSNCTSKTVSSVCRHAFSLGFLGKGGLSLLVGAHQWVFPPRHGNLSASVTVSPL
jgi:hypothetical protein